MAIADVLRDIGQGVTTGAKAVGAVAQPVLERAAQVVSGEAPQIDEEKRRQAEALEDAQINVKSQALEQQLAMGQKYGTLTPEQQQSYVDQITQLYSNPRHSATLMEKLRQTIHPKGAFAQVPSAPLPTATPPGGTVAADEAARERAAAVGENIKADQARKQAVDTANFLASQLPPGTSDADRTKFRNNALDHILHASTGKEPSPKGMKAIEVAGVAAGITDQDTGKQYLPAQLGPGGDAPPEAKQMWSSIQNAEKQKKDEADQKWQREQKEIEKRQRISNDYMLERMGMQFQNMIAAGNFRSANAVVQGLEKNYATSQTLESRMKQLEPKALGGDQQAMLAILANHIAMTTHQPGSSMRPTKALFDEAASAQPWLQKIEKRVGPDGVISGVVLSPQQIRQMVDLAPIMVNSDLQALTQAKEMMGNQLNPVPAKPTGAKKVANILKPPTTKQNVIVVSPEDMK